MDAGYVRRKELSEGGTAGFTLFANVVLVVNIFQSDGCNDDKNCATLVFLFMSMIVYVVAMVLVALLAVLQKQNEKTRKDNEEIRNSIEKIKKKKQNKKIRRQNKKRLIQQDEIPEIVNKCGIKDLERKEDELKGKEKSNDNMNNAILVLTIIGTVLNIVINALNLKLSKEK